MDRERGFAFSGEAAYAQPENLVGEFRLLDLLDFQLFELRARRLPVLLPRRLSGIAERSAGPFRRAIETGGGVDELDGQSGRRVRQGNVGDTQAQAPAPSLQLRHLRLRVG